MFLLNLMNAKAFSEILFLPPQKKKYVTWSPVSNLWLFVDTEGNIGYLQVHILKY